MAGKQTGKPKGSPFESLRDLSKRLGAKEEAQREAQRESNARLARERTKAHEETDLWAEALRGVKPIERPSELLRRPTPRVISAGEYLDEEMEEFMAVADGRAPLDYSASDEFVEGRAQDCSFRLLGKLKNGDFALQSHIDLHGLNREDAKLAVGQFLDEAQAKGHRCVLIVSGRGLRSPGRVPVIKQLLVDWLAHGKFSKRVLAFCSARNHDGGLGAVYVLLRRAGNG